MSSADEAAPCGFEPCGSDNMSPFSEPSTPPYLKWAEDLRFMLNDYEGMLLFKDFLRQSDSIKELEFWYACNGFKKNMQTNDDKVYMMGVAKSICGDFINSRGCNYLKCIKSETGAEVQRHLRMQNELNDAIFNAVQLEVEENLRLKHEDFCRSEMYVAFLQNVQDTEGMEAAPCYYNDKGDALHSSSSNSGDALRPSSSMLPTLHEEAENELFECVAEKLSNYGQSDIVKSNDRDSSLATAASTSKEQEQQSHHCSSKQTSKKQSDFDRVANFAKNLTNNINQSVADKKKSSSAASSSVGAPCSTSSAMRKLTHSALVKTLDQRMSSTVLSAEPGLPPHPYQTTRPYVPYLTTSAQDSELQSMSSDAATESSASGVNFRFNERHAGKYAKQNLENQNLIIPRTQRMIDKQPQNMMNEEFRRDVLRKCEEVRRDLEQNQKINEGLAQISEAGNQTTSRAAVQQICNLQASAPDCDESILENHISMLRSWHDSPKQSPLRSPGNFHVGGRRRSPGSSSPDRRINRIMTTSYPGSYQQMASAHFMPIGPYQQQTMRNRQPPSVGGEQFVHLTQSAIISQNINTIVSPKQRAGVGGAQSHSASNTLHRYSKTVNNDNQLSSSTDNFSQSDNRRFTNQNHRRSGPAFSDTSGISSTVSSDPSLVGSNNLQSSSVKPKVRSSGAAVHGNPAVSSKAQKQSGASKPAESASKPIGADKSRMQRTNAADATIVQDRLLRLNLVSGVGGTVPRRSVGSAASVDLGSASTVPKQQIVVVYKLPNESTPFRTKFNGSSMQLVDFKGLLVKKGNYRYLFKARIENDEFWEEVVNDYETVPSYNQTVEARVEAVE